MLRRVDRAVFTPRPRVDSALLRLVRTGPAASEWMVEGRPRRVRAPPQDARRLARARRGRGPGRRRARRSAELGIAESARAEQLTPAQFEAVAERLR